MEANSSTRVLGTVKSITSGLKIIVYNRYDFTKVSGYSKISLYNLEEIYNLVTSYKKEDHSLYELLVRNSDVEPYEFSTEDKAGTSGFNVIIYLSNIDSSPIGFTEFNNTQGRERDIWIYPEQTATVSEFSITLSNSLTSLINNTTSATKTYIGTGLKDYTSLGSIRVKNGNKKGYTRNISEVKYKSSELGVHLDSGLVRNNSEALEYIKLSVERDTEFSPYGYEFTNFGLSYYGDDIVLYTWNGENYCATSLTKRNKFGNLIVYTKSGTGYFTLPASKEYEKNTILYTAGKYIVCESTVPGVSNKKFQRLFDIETREWIQPDYKFILDALDPTNTVIELPNSLTYKDIGRYIPSLVNANIDLSGNMQINIIRKIGNWFLLRRTIKGNTMYIWAGISNVIYLTEDEINDFMVLDDNTIVRYFNDSVNPRYYFYGGIKQTYYTYEARKILNGKDSSDPKILHTRKKNPITKKWDNDSGYYEIYETFLNDFRRGAYPIDIIGIPDIVCMIDGIIFYKTGNYINYL